MEVTTFRGPHEEQYDETHSESGMTLSDNIYGTFQEDVFRRDFTMNAVYYEPQNKELIDLADGLTDIEAGTIRTIGTPDDRLREDPVRMLRAIRFKAKLSFDIDPETSTSIKSLGYLVQDVAASRLFEHVLKLFMAGSALATFDSLMEHDLYGWLFPDSKRSMTETATEELVKLAFASTDRRIEEELPVTPAFLFAAILWYPFFLEKKRLEDEGLTHTAASHDAANNIISKQQLFTSIPKRFTGPMRDIWFLQFRLPNRAGRKPDVLLEHKRFRAAYDFLLLRERAGELTNNLGAWWTEYQEADPDRRATMKRDTGQTGTGKKRKRRRKRKPRSSTVPGDQISWP